MKNAPKFSRGASLHLGVNNFDPLHYQNWQGNLTKAEADAKDLANIARMMGFEVSVLLGEDATVDRAGRQLRDALKNSETGDILLLTFSGYAGFLPAGIEPDKQASKDTWCLYDAQLMQDAIIGQLASFDKKLRVLVLSDCGAYNPLSSPFPKAMASGSGLAKSLPEDIGQSTYLGNKDYYDSQILRNTSIRPDNLLSSVQWLNACHDNQTAFERKFNGLFTAAIKSVWKGGSFDKPYDQFFDHIRWRMPAYQTPKLVRMGRPYSGFYRETPFQI